MANRADIGVIGGSGFYSLLDDAEEVEVTTPYGPPSDVVTVGRIGSRSVAFLPRHGRDHRFPPHRIPYRANLWALRSLGVRQVLAPSAVGSLRAEVGAGRARRPRPARRPDLRPRRRPTTTHGGAVHVVVRRPLLPVAGARQPWRPPGRRAGTLVDGGTLVVIEGPRFSTRAESRWFPPTAGRSSA